MLTAMKSLLKQMPSIPHDHHFKTINTTAQYKHKCLPPTTAAQLTLQPRRNKTGMTNWKQARKQQLTREEGGGRGTQRVYRYESEGLHWQKNTFANISSFVQDKSAAAKLDAIASLQH